MTEWLSMVEHESDEVMSSLFLLFIDPPVLEERAETEVELEEEAVVIVVVDIVLIEDKEVLEEEVISFSSNDVLVGIKGAKTSSTLPGSSKMARM